MVFLGVYRAIYDYAPQSEEELALTEGDLLYVLEKSTEDMWWKCKKKAASEEEDEPEGLVPNNYIEEAKPIHQARALYDYTQQTEEEFTFKEETRLDVYDDSDADWALVGYNGEFGFAPANYIERVSASAPIAAVAPVVAATPADLATSAPPRQRELAPPPMPTRPTAPTDAIPGEADYPGPSSAYESEPPPHNPATALAGIIGGSGSRSYASPPPPGPQYTPEESEEEAPPMPQRPASQQIRIASPPNSARYAPPRSPDPPLSSPAPRFQHSYDQDQTDAPHSPGGYHLYNVHEMVSHMGKNKKMPTVLGINNVKGLITISPEKSKDGPSKEWTAEKLQHYSIEGKHVFMELVRPSKSIDFHAGAKDTAQEIVAQLGELAGAVRAEGLREVIAASGGTGVAGLKKGKMVYDFVAQSSDEVTVAIEDEVIILDDAASDEWWKVRRMKNGKEGVVPSSYVEITGTVPRESDTINGLDAARSTVEQNRLEEERLAKEASRRDKGRQKDPIPTRDSSLQAESNGHRNSARDSRGSRDQTPKSKPNQNHVRTWTDRSGTFRVDAEFIGLRENKIHLHKLNGVKIAVPVGKMSVEDLEYVEKATGASLDEDKPLSDIKRRNTQKQKVEDRPSRPVAGATIQPKDQEFWFDFFLECGVNPQICERYAIAFSKDQMTKDVLEDINEPLLRTLGLKEGDILRVMKHLDTKFDRKKNATGGAPEEAAELANAGGLFSGPGGALKNNTRKGRPAPAVQTQDVIDESAFKTKDVVPAASPSEAPPRRTTGGFDDDAWDVKPARSQTPTAAPVAAPTQPVRVVETPRLINEDIASLSMSAPPLQPTPAPAPAPVVAPVPQIQPTQPVSPTAPSQPQGADQAIFDKIAQLAPHPPRQRPAPPTTQQTGGALGVPPPPRAASAPGLAPQQQQFMQIQPQLTGYANPAAIPQGYGGYQQANGFQPQPTGVQAVQQNYPPLQPQPTGLNFQPQSMFGQQQQMQMQPTGFVGGQNFNQPQPTGFMPQMQSGYPPNNYQQQYINGGQAGSPFADPTSRPYQPSQPSGLANAFGPPSMQFAQQPQQQPAFNISQPTGLGTANGGFGQPPPQLPPQQTGGVFGPSQPLGGAATPAPLVAQKTGPAPPVRFGVTPGAKPLRPQPTGRANLANATPQNPFGF